jgi:hypothetical protein
LHNSAPGKRAYCTIYERRLTAVQDPWLHAKRVKDIARDLNKMYGFDKDMLFELPKAE